MLKSRKKIMVTITKELLDMFPTWETYGWRVGDTFNLLDYFSQNKVNTFVDEHPPHRPS